MTKPNGSEIVPVPQPELVEPDQVIENVYLPDDPQQVGNRFDQVAAGEYLAERHEEDVPPSQVVVEETIVTHRDVTRLRRDGWVFDITPIRAVALSVIAFAGVNVLANVVKNRDAIAHDVDALASAAGNGVKDLLGFDDEGGESKKPAKPQTEIVGTLAVQNKIVTVSQSLPTGSSEVRAATARRLLDKIEKAEADGYTLDQVASAGEATDQWLTNPRADMGVKSPAQNGALSKSRATSLAKKLMSVAKRRDMKLPEINIVGQENDLSEAQINSLEQSNGLTIEEQVRDRTSLPESAKGRLARALGKPKVVASALLSKTTYTENEVTLDTPPKTAPDATSESDPGPDYDLDWFPSFPIIPLPRLRRYLKRKFKTTKVNIAEEVRDPAVLKLYPEARSEEDENVLKKHTWMYTRLYQVLMREDRIKQVLTHSFDDDDEKRQNVRVMFIDHEPTDETVELYRTQLDRMALFQGGKVPEHLSTIAVFPTGNTGKSPDNPKRIGLGIDTQYASGTLGVAIPALNLSEAHMSPNPTEEEVNRMMGVLWVDSHENGGHFTDTDKQPTTIRPIDGTDMYAASNPWLDTLEKFRASHPALHEVPVEDLVFRIERRVTDAKGQVIPLVDYVDYRDPRIHESQRVELVNAAPTMYSAGEGELHAEVAGQVLSGIPIPFSEAIPRSHIPQTGGPGNFAEGYVVSSELLEGYAEHLGATLVDRELTWPEDYRAKRQASTVVTLTRPEDDPFMAEAMKFARERAWPSEEELIKILVSAPLSSRK